MPRRQPRFDQLKSEYAALWASAETRADFDGSYDNIHVADIAAGDYTNNDASPSD